MPSCFVSLCFLFTTRNRAKLAPRHFCLLRVPWQRVNKTRHKHTKVTSLLQRSCASVYRVKSRARAYEFGRRPGNNQNVNKHQQSLPSTTYNARFQCFPRDLYGFNCGLGLGDYKIWNIKLILSSGKFKKVSSRRLGMKTDNLFRHV